MPTGFGYLLLISCVAKRLSVHFLIGRLNYLHFVYIFLLSDGCVTNPILPRYIGWFHNPRSLNSFQNCWYSLYLFLSFANDGAALPVRNTGGRRII